jgi:tetratricopeptide (TPR) repeat protein
MLFANLTDSRIAYIMRLISWTQGADKPDAVINQVRLFRKDPRHLWIYRVHEQITPSLTATGTKIAVSPVDLLDQGYLDADIRRRKLERNLRLMELDVAERPNDRFCLFNLGATYVGLNRPAEALPFLQQSLDEPGLQANIGGRLYAMIGGCYEKLGQNSAALHWCERGRRRHPDDPELRAFQARLLTLEKKT